ncbi:MAG: phosphotransferase [Oligoflexia bacterium]|nr:phosphotransferase [Oligoflexia bacterium]
MSAEPEPQNDPKMQISEWLESRARKGGRMAVRSITKIPGDASTRVYYRVVADNGSSYILARVEPFADQKDKYAFLAVREHLEHSKVDVPRVFDYDAELGFVLQEDLGDVTLLRCLQEVSSGDVERHLYERVIDSLVTLQLEASQSHGKDLDCFKLRFDHEKLMWEVNFAIEHFYQLHLGRNIGETDLNVIRDGFSEICDFLASQPTVLTHRDFHSRNIMVVGEAARLVMIDFQDARMGPAQYDLASLLRDSYYQLEQTQIERLLDYYIVNWEARSGAKLNRSEFFYVFDMMSVQRNFKAIGSFASFLNRRGNPTYLKYIGNTFENIRRTLLKYPKYAKLRETLFHYYYF